MSVNIDIYLKDAFRVLDTFSVPDIGTFRKVHISSSMDDHEKEVFPPRIEVEYSARVDQDVSLTEYLIQREQMPVNEAVKITGEISGLIWDALNRSGNFEVENVGALRRDQEGRLSFVSHISQNPELSGEYFGLQPISVSSHAVEETYIAPYNEQEMKPEETMEFEKPARRRNRTIARVATISVVAILVLGAGAYLSFQNEGFVYQEYTRSSLEVVSWPEQLDDEMLFADRFTGNQQEIEELGPDQVSFDNKLDEGFHEVEAPPVNDEVREIPVSQPNARLSQPEPEQQTRSVQPGVLRGQDIPDQNEGDLSNLPSNHARKASNIQYHLIAGSFSQYEAATRFVRQLSNEGYAGAKILDPEPGQGTHYRVSVFRSADQPSMEKFKKQQQKLGKKNWWILEQVIR